MVNPEELAICRRRGHKVLMTSLAGGWMPCEACGMWLREKRILEEREDEPPEEEWAPAARTDRNIACLREKFDKLNRKSEGGPEAR
jgi:hypothetical protein